MQRTPWKRRVQIKRKRIIKTNQIKAEVGKLTDTDD